MRPRGLPSKDGERRATLEINLHAREAGVEKRRRREEDRGKTGSAEDGSPRSGDGLQLVWYQVRRLGKLNVPQETYWPYTRLGPSGKLSVPRVHIWRYTR